MSIESECRYQHPERIVLFPSLQRYHRARDQPTRWNHP